MGGRGGVDILLILASVRLCVVMPDGLTDADLAERVRYLEQHAYPGGLTIPDAHPANIEGGVFLGEVDETPTDDDYDAGTTAIYVKSDGNVYKRPHGGNEAPLGAGDNIFQDTNGDGTYEQTEGNGLDVPSLSTDEATLNDTATSPSTAGEFRLNGTDIEAYTGGGVKTLSDIGSGASFPVSQDLQIEKSSSFSGGTQIENMTFTAQNTGLNVLPDPREAQAGGPLSNAILLNKTDFQPGQLSSDTNLLTRYTLTGSQMTTDFSGEQLTISNSTGATAEEHFQTPASPPGPHFAAMLHVDAWSGTTNNNNPEVGVMQDASNRVQALVDTANTEIKVFEEVGGTTSATTLSTSIPSPPFDLYVIFAGSLVHVFTNEKNAEGGYTYHGAANTGVDLYNNATRDNYSLYAGAYVDDTNSVTLDGMELLQTPQLGWRDMHPVTYLDGAPLIRENKVYLTTTGAADDQNTGQAGYMMVVTLDLTTYEFELVGALFNESESGNAYNDHAGAVHYDPDTDEFMVTFTGWGTYNHGGDSKVNCYVTRTQRDVLHGVNLVSTAKMNLPSDASQASGNTTDPFVVYDSAAGAYRCVHGMDGAFKIGVSETTDDSLTSGWTNLHNHRDNTNKLEGGTISKVDGEYVITHMYQGVASNSASADYPDISANVQNLSFSPANGGAVPWAAVIPVPDGGETKYLIVNNDSMASWGISNGSVRGNYWVYEADQRGTGYEHPYRSVHR